jgi:hypothetical protein
VACPKLRSIIEDHNARRAALPRREQISDPELTLRQALSRRR